MKLKLLFLSFLLPIFLFAQSQNKQKSCAISLIEKSISAFGGSELLDSIHSLQIKGKGYRLMREQSERPEGPYITDYFEGNEIADFQHNRWLSRKDFGVFGYSLSYLVNDSITARSFNGNTNWFPAEKSLEEELFLNPLQILKTALSASDLKCEKDTLLQNMEHSVISFQWKQVPVKIFINKISDLITAIETTETYPFNNYHIWGDITKTIFYSLYGLEKNGLRFPYQRDIYMNGKLSENFMLTSLEQNPKITETMEIPRETSEKIAQYLANPPVRMPQKDKIITEKEGINIVPGSWFSAIIRQNDGLVIIDAPINSAYGSGILELASKLYPNEKVKAVISSSGAWPHLGGLRPFIASEIPIYHSPLNTLVIEELAHAPFTNHPDELQKTPGAIKSKPVSEKTILGSGPNRLEIYPMNSEGSEGMLMVYFPQQKLLYTSDLVQGINNPEPAPYFREYWKEALELIDQKKLDVEKVYGMHMAPVNISELRKALGTEKEIKVKTTK